MMKQSLKTFLESQIHDFPYTYNATPDLEFFNCQVLSDLMSHYARFYKQTKSHLQLMKSLHNITLAQIL